MILKNQISEYFGQRGKTVLLSANRGYALTSTRTILIQHFLFSGWNVVIATADDEESRSLVETGAFLEPVTFNRGGLSPLNDITAYQRLQGIYKKWSPALIQHFHARPVILGSVAARRALGDGVKVVNTITGIGNAFTAGGITARLAGMGYSLTKSRTNMTIFQNRDDLDLFVKGGWVDESKAILTCGDGVDIERFTMVDRNKRDDKAPVVVMLGRLLRQKGVPEFVEVAKRVQAAWPGAKFLLAGEEDLSHPDSVTTHWIERQKSVQYVGRLSDVVPLLTKADLLLFPSSYREGLPRVIQEAAATGLPTIAFDVPGVREAVRDGETGYLVRCHDVDALTQKVQELIENTEKRLRMGQAARKLATNEFDIRSIIKQYIRIYNEIGIKI